ncbi:mechanosensitive ion channel family protein [Halorubellus sp. PRR65]|uniref:mechanosensitive ion channel family protein n=1 Tax=Halorubellus sp. PRR65 TaxID=3098148 RepID=UPI002B258680|nr:mechanosensitive ion channel family protein [Halorubellus sp. PRR65]
MLPRVVRTSNALQLRPARRLFEEFFALALDASVLVVVVAAIYFPGRYLLVPALGWLLDALNVDDAFALPAVNLLQAIILLFAAFAGFTVSGLASFLAATQAITAGATIAIGFASRDVLGNLVSGAFIVLDPTYNIGDWIQWNDSEGIIEDISFRVTRIHTFDNELVVVPNSELTANAVTNPAAKDRLRVTTTFGIGYEDDIERAQSVIVETVLANDDIVDRPGPTVRVAELGDNAILLDARFWIADPARSDFVRIRSDLTTAVKSRFDEEGISLPAPQRELSGAVATTRVDGEH